VQRHKRQLRKLTKSEQMARVRSTDTGTEFRLRRALWRQGLRYRVRQRVEGTPDITFPSEELAIFVDGCFWHGCPLHYSAPASNEQFWRAKLERNQARDRRVDQALANGGWKVIRIWEHEVIKGLDEAVAMIRSLVEENRAKFQTTDRAPL
jgi:DNA mismatch endonuclease (patch repair protein)